MMIRFAMFLGKILFDRHPSWCPQTDPKGRKAKKPWGFARIE
jgi:hypothetical protein